MWLLKLKNYLDAILYVFYNFKGFENFKRFYLVYVFTFYVRVR